MCMVQAVISSLMKQPPLTFISRTPKRLSITISDKAFQQISQLSYLEGRSMSNLAAYLLEQALEERTQAPKGR